MRKMKDSGIAWIGDVPVEWGVVRLNKTGRIVTGNTPPKDNSENYYSDTNGLMWIKPENLNGFNGLSKPKEFLNDDGVQYARIVPENTVLVCCIGTVGKFSFTQEKVAFNQQINGVMFDDELVYWKYGLYFISSQEQQHLFYATGNVVLILNTQKQGQIYCCIPPLVEQTLIADYLDHKTSKIDSIIEREKQHTEKLKEYKKSVITEAVTKGIDPNVPMKNSGIEWIGEVPVGWDVRKIKQLAHLNPKCDTSSFSDNSIVTFTPMECVKNGYFINQFSNYGKLSSSHSLFEEGDIIMAKVTPCFENGNIAIVGDLYNRFGFGSSELFVLRYNKASTKFMYYLLQNSTFKERATSEMTGAGGLKRVPAEFICEYKFALPPLTEQTLIADYLDHKCSKIDNTIIKKETLIAKLTEYKKSLIYEAVTGKVETNS